MKKFIRILLIFVLVVATYTPIYAIAIPDSAEQLAGEQTGVESVTNVAKGIWSTVTTIVQILAVAAVVFAGLRYMFSSADKRADIKRSVGFLVIGAILVFCTTLVLNFIVDATNSVVGY